MGVVGLIWTIHSCVTSELREIKHEKALNLSAHQVVSLTRDNEKALEGKLVYLYGSASVQEPLKDPITGVVAKSIRLARNVQVFEWVQDKQTHYISHGASWDTYTYSQEWSDYLYHSHLFRHPEGHQNPSTLSINTLQFDGRDVHLNQYAVSSPLVHCLPAQTAISVNLNDRELKNISAKLKKPVELYAGGLYVGKDPEWPEVGDLKITYYVAEQGPHSVVAKKSGATLLPYAIPKQETIGLVRKGIIPSAGMFKQAVDESQGLILGERLLAAFFLGCSLYAISLPFTFSFSMIPLLGELFDDIEALACLVVALLLEGVLIAGTWMAYSPQFALSVTFGVWFLCVAIYGGYRLTVRLFHFAERWFGGPR
jgi:hypothetical protein